MVTNNNSTARAADCAINETGAKKGNGIILVDGLDFCILRASSLKIKRFLIATISSGLYEFDTKFKGESNDTNLKCLLYDIQSILDEIIFAFV